MDRQTQRVAVVDNAAQGLLELLTDAGLDAVEFVEQVHGKGQQA